MSHNLIGLEMKDLQNAIDAEFEAAKVTNFCIRSTRLLFNRTDALSGKQLQLKNSLESIDAQLKQAEELHNRNSRSRSESTERRINGGGRDSPIVIDDEEEIFVNTTIQQDSQKPPGDGPPPGVPVTQQVLHPSDRVVMLANVRRRSLIVERTADPLVDTVNLSTGLRMVSATNMSTGPGMAASELTAVRQLSNEVQQPAIASMTPALETILSSPIPVSTSSTTGGNGSSTESACSSFNDRSRSPLGSDDFEVAQSNFDPPSSVGSTTSSPLTMVGRSLRRTELRASSASPFVSRRPHDPSDFIVGSRVLGKRSSDIWFPGEITKMIHDKQKQTKYTIKYDKNQKGVLSLNHICPEGPATVEDLSVGSRVVGLYGRLDLWYAGIVAEMPCTDNRNRFLIFFDDGFAQYLSSKKLHKVHHKGKNVWEDVAEHSRDFIQEYLEDYPSRPMLHIRVGQWIRTEWMGQWLKAKVLSVDGSLAKMLFQVDNRSEWIYRGSTRLDPLYRALVLGEKTTSAKARSRKLTRNASSKGNTPYIEYNITKPSFGISPYSKTDPQGFQQLQLEEQRKRTQLQQQPLQETKHTKKSVESSEVNQPKTLTEKVNEREDTSLAKSNEANLIFHQEPVSESTFSSIQASTLRKRTGASLVNNSVFKPIEPVPINNTPHVTTSLKVPQISITTIPLIELIQKTVDEAVVPMVPAVPHANPQWTAPWLKDQRNKQRHTTENVVKPDSTGHTSKPHDVAAMLRNKLDASTVDMKQDTAAVNETSPAVKLDCVRRITGPHTCNSACSEHTVTIPINPLRHNPFAVPLLVDWKRELVKRRGKTNKRDVYYRTPCHRRLRNMAEVLHYLKVTRDARLAVDQFTFDWRVFTKDTIQSSVIVADISNGQENRPLPAVNEIDCGRPPNVKYVSHRQLAAEVELCKDPGFMVCCDCVDNCSDSAKCSCIQLTIQGCKAIDGKDNDKKTYQYKRLKDCIQTGIYECNSKCPCTKSCLNRVVQNGIQIRMEVFKTENRGWGLRSVDDIPAGTFICTYAGYLLNEELANQGGRDYGDEYMAELDYIEVAEKAKEGYESGVSDLEEDDNVIHEMLEFDENLSGSENSVSDGSYRDEDLEEEEEDEEEEEEEDEDEDDDDNNDGGGGGGGSLSEDNCSLSSEDDGVFGQRRKTLRSSKRKKVFKSQQKKKRGTVSEESLVVERESKASVLSRLTDPLMCILALKRNGNDLRKSLRFLRKIMAENLSMDSEQPMIFNEKHDQLSNGVSGCESERRAILSNSEFDLDEMSDDALAAIHGSGEETLKPTNCAARDDDEREIIPELRASVSVEEDKERPRTGILESERKSSPTTKEGIDVAKERVPELLSADDLKRLAASQPKSMEPPVLSKVGETRRGNVLNETIEKLKKRVTSEAIISNSEVAPAETTGTGNEVPLGGEKHESESRSKQTDDVVGGSEKSDVFDNCASEREQNMAADDDKRSLQSEASLFSQNSSSVSQSTSSRSSSPATLGGDNGTEKPSGKVMAGDKSSLKGDDAEVNNGLSVKHVKTRSFFGEEHCYVIDAKAFGNCGRFLNHSCSPNLFVQNVFVDTHDLRFPWVAFFAQHNIKAGAELSWDYMYEVGSVRDKVLHCLCGSSECRGRLL